MDWSVRTFRTKRVAALFACTALVGCAVEPTPIAPEVHAERTASDLEHLRKVSFEPDGPITLHQAMAQAVAFNLQRRVNEIQREIEDAELKTKNYDMLPALDLDGAWNRSSEQLSTTDDRITTTGSASITWNVLDLGVSYARAKQQSDEVMIARERERKALQDIIREVRTAYWRAAGAQRLMGRIKAIGGAIRVAIRESRAMERSGANDVATSVSYRREIIESVRQALTIQRELREARSELAELLNIRSGTDFVLATPVNISAVPGPPMTLEEMEEHALLNRPELRIEDYNERMSVWQAREALFDMLPGIKMTSGTNYTSDQFNLTPNWISTGLQLGFNIFDLFSGTSKIDEAEKRGELARRQRLAVTLAVMTQTHLGYVKYRNASQHLRLAREMASADRRLAQLVASDRDFMNTDYFEAVRLATRQLQSEMDEHRARIELITAHSEIIHAIGLDVIERDTPWRDLDTLTADIKRVTAAWDTDHSALPQPSDTSLDVLVNAILQGGENPRLSDKPIEIRAPAPESLPDPLSVPASPELREARAEEQTDDDFVATGVSGATPGTVAATAKQVSSVEPASGPADDRPAAVPGKEKVAEVEAETVRIAEPGPAAPAEPVTSEPAPDAKSAGEPINVVQLGVFRSEPKAERLRSRLTDRSDAALHGVEVRVVRRAANNGERLHYVETGAIPDMLMARELCATLKDLGHDCITLVRAD